MVDVAVGRFVFFGCVFGEFFRIVYLGKTLGVIYTFVPLYLD
jgi:hypothetical protein